MTHNRTHNRTSQHIVKINIKEYLLLIISVAILGLFILFGCTKVGDTVKTNEGYNTVDNVKALFGSRYDDEKELWSIIQYADSSGKQNSFYLIVSNRGRVVAVDGGWRDNGQSVADEIKRYGGHVDAWILTHPHPDHIGAFNEVYKGREKSGIVIDAIYDNALDYDYYDTVDEEWDEIDVYQEYLDIVSDDEGIHHVLVGDQVEVGSLNINFYNAYNENVQSVVTDIGNNASLIFTVSTDEKSMLFVGDCYSEAIINHVFATYGADINVSMAQMPHHGNSTLPDSYYEQLDLDICFFDAPAWLVEGEGYTTRGHMDAMEGGGVFCYDQSTSPNAVALYDEAK